MIRSQQTLKCYKQFTKHLCKSLLCTWPASCSSHCNQRSPVHGSVAECRPEVARI